MTDIDCVIVGNNQMRFDGYEATIRAMGPESGAYRDIRLSYYHDDSDVVTCRDFCNRRQGVSAREMSYDDILGATIPYLGSFLHRHGLTFDFVNSFQEGRDDLERLLRRNRVMTVAVTTTYYVSPLPLLEVVDFVRRVDPTVRIVVGGPFVRTQNEVNSAAAFRFLLRQIGADFYVVSHQGEQALADLLLAIRDGRAVGDIPNVIHQRGGDYVHNVLVREENDLARNPVDWSLFASHVGYDSRRMVSVRTAQSCPFACAFCSFPVHAGSYRYLDPSDVWTELDQIEELGSVNSVTFIDDTFNVPPGRFKRILHGLRERRYSFRWNCNFRCQFATPEIVELMCDAGCEGVFLGLESGSDAVLANMNKSATSRSYRRGVELLRDAGILTHASFIVGFPGETSDTVRETIDFIETVRPDYFRAQLWYYDTMTPIRRDAERYGLRNSQFEWSHDTMTSGQAADWVDHMHGTVESSVWLPQNDFDFPSLFCLSSRGWTRDEISSAVTEFNERVRRDLDQDGPATGFLNEDLVRDAAFDFGTGRPRGADRV